MEPGGPLHGQLLVGCGGLTADPGIDLASQTWLHSVFACPFEMDECVPITQVAKKAQLVQSGIVVPGTRDEGKTISRSRPFLRRLLRQLYELLWSLRRAGFSLRGNFSVDNFQLYRPHQKKRKAAEDRAAEERITVRLTGSLQLSRYTPEDAVEDDRTFVWSVREMLKLNSKQPVPLEICDRLNLINARGVGNEYLIRFHIHLMEPRAGLSVLMSFRRRIDYLMSNRPQVYASIVSRMSLFQGWNTPDLHFKNNLMEAALVYNLNQSGRTAQDSFDPNVRGILKIIRDCAQHPANRFEDYMLLILEEDFTAFAALLQFVMFRAEQLPFLHLENTMG